jgi:glycosyltransferase involved in cell wall biosynthesis
MSETAANNNNSPLNLDNEALPLINSTSFENQKKVHLWIPNIFEFKGGIQVYSKFLIQALQGLHIHANYSIFIKHDSGAKSDICYLPNTKFYVSGQWPLSLRTLAFSAQIIASGLCQSPNLVIATHLNFTVAAYWLKRLTGIPYWTIAHGVEAWNIQRPDLKTVLHYADRILAVSNYTRDRLLKEQNLDPNKVSVLPNTFEPHRFQIGAKPTYLLERHALKPDQSIILTVSRLCQSESYKGYDKILEALPQIRQSIPNVHYIIGGKGDDRPRIEQLIQQLQLQDRVTLAGFIPDPELCDYYNLCDVFAMPSKLEGFGIVYLEALACGKPTLGGNQDGAIDALCHGELGALVNPDDVGAIAQTLIQILQGNYPNPLIYQPEALRQKVTARYGFEQFKQTLAQHLERYFLSNPSLEAPI